MRRRRGNVESPQRRPEAFAVYNRLNPKKPTTDADDDELKDLVADRVQQERHRRCRLYARGRRHDDPKALLANCTRCRTCGVVSLNCSPISGGLEISLKGRALLSTERVRRTVPPPTPHPTLLKSFAWRALRAPREIPGWSVRHGPGRTSERCPLTTLAARHTTATPL